MPTPEAENDARNAELEWSPSPPKERLCCACCQAASVTSAAREAGSGLPIKSTYYFYLYALWTPDGLSKIIHICDVHITNSIFTNTFYMYFFVVLDV